MPRQRKARRPRSTAKPPGPPGSAGPPRLKARVWVEVDGAAALTEAGADLLEQIQVAGSLSEAARRLGMSYRWAWLLLDGMNRRWPAPLATTATGGKRGGGAALTDYGRLVLSAYRDLGVRLEHMLDEAGRDFLAATRSV